MKKIVFLAVFVFSVAKSYSLPVGNPTGSSLFFYEVPRKACLCDENIFCWDGVRVGLGFYGDYVFNRNLETVTGKKVDFSHICTNAGYLSLNFWNVFDLFTTLGATKFTFNTSLGPFNSTNPSPRFDFESSSAFSWSIGARGTIWKYKQASLGVMSQYFSSCPAAKVLFVRANVDAHPDESSSRRYSEWQLGAGISYRYNCYFIPYAALKYNRALWEFNNQTFLVTDTPLTIPNLRNDKCFGYAIGLELAPFKCEKVVLTVEGRFADENAVFVNGHLYF